ncbi:WD40-repeat-containing domain protein [Rhodofomes roseus]|uniref:WD40-repeat-containing domain protein n=1 Tax=Rhodofomes roseus TaxID=34475 RepID=A0ABQ8KE47_9APHY|nr:WD40-repeat-containing domain protein [Rhodofomes roseus]KAH9835897.1 WD40-repeat-containing domain protein [Rhodofomes roseus]
MDALTGIEDDAYAGPDAYVEGNDGPEDLDFEIEEGEDEDEDEDDEDDEEEEGGFDEETDVGTLLNGNGQPTTITLDSNTLAQVQRLLGFSRGVPVTSADRDEDEDDEDEYFNHYGHSGKWDRTQDWWPEIKEPKKEGLQLLMGGEFGRLKHQLKSRKKDNNIARLALNRGTRIRPAYKEDLANELLPNSNGTAVAQYAANAYVGQYSSDSTFYYTCVRDFRLHVYDTTAPLSQRNVEATRNERHGHTTSMKVIKTIPANPGRWTITDSHLSPDNQRMIYASIGMQSNTVYMTTTLDPSPVQHPIRFGESTGNQVWDYEDDFGIWSCKFSADGNEVIAGGSSMIFGNSLTFWTVYDLIADQRTVKIQAHTDDVNSCCWADTASGNILVSASDDTFIKVWDRRSLGASPKPSGVLIGHTEGITYVSAKGDGRYVISNGKDQVLRLWDLRMMRSNDDFERVERTHYGVPHFDYRWVPLRRLSHASRDSLSASSGGSYPRPKYKAHPLDCSVMQYTGHEVLRTLIRCHFSPAETTGQQYIYSGSSDGRIHIWSLDGRVVQVLDRSQTLPMSFDPSGPDPPGLHTAHKTKTCVRDVSWHCEQPVLMSAGWLGTRWGNREGSTIARHEWKGLSKMNNRLQDYVEKQQQELPHAESARSLRSRQRRMPGSAVFDTMRLTPTESHLNTEFPVAMNADLNLYGFPPGYFIIRSVATGRLLDVEMGWADDGTQMILYTENETSLVDSMRDPAADNQVFFIDTSGVGTIPDDCLVLRHRRPVLQPFPNSYSHPLPRFSYDRQTKNIAVTFASDPSYPKPGPERKTWEAWKEMTFLVTAVPARKPRGIIDDASQLLTSAITTPLSLFGALRPASSATPETVFASGEVDLREDEILEQERSEEGEVDDSPERRREVRVLALAKEEVDAASAKAKLRRQWEVIPLRASRKSTSY